MSQPSPADSLDLDRQMVCATCGWKGPLGIMKLSKHVGGMLDCPKCGGPDTHFAEGNAREVEFDCPIPPSERH